MKASISSTTAISDIDDSWHDPELEAKFNKISGPASESSLQFIFRSYNGLVNRICHPERRDYTSSEISQLTEKALDSMKKATRIFEIIEKDLTLSRSHGSIIHSIYWKSRISKQQEFPESTNFEKYQENVKVQATATNKLCVLYLHTNTRNALDAIEALPLCEQLNADLVAIDLPGHGKSHTHNETMSGTVSLQAVDEAIAWLSKEHSVTSILVYCRGMATAVGIEYCASINYQTTLPPTTLASRINIFRSNRERLNRDAQTAHGNQTDLTLRTHCTHAAMVRGLVLDTPYTSIADMVNDAVDNMHKNGHYVPKVLFNFGSRIVRSSVTSQLGFDPYSVRPITYFPSISIPIYIAAMSRDDYIPTKHACAMFSCCNPETPCTLSVMDGSHFSSRPLTLYSDIVKFMTSSDELFMLISGGPTSSLDEVS